MDSVTTSKQLYFYAACTILLLVLAIILIFRRKPIDFVFNRLDVAIVAFWLWAMIRAAFTDYISWNDDGIITLGLLLFVYFIVKNIVTSEQRNGGTKVFSILAIGFMAGGLIESVYGALQLYGIDPFPTKNYFRLVGSFGNPDALAGYLSSVMPFALGMFLLIPQEEQELRFVRQMGMATFFAGLFILPATMIRGAWLGVAVGSLVVLSVRFDLLKKTKAIFSRTFSRVLIAMGLIVCIIAIGYGLYNLKPDSANGRLLIWKITGAMIKDHPLWGIGFDRFAVEYGNYQAAYFASGIGTPTEEYLAGNVHHAHNEFLQLFAELGFVGLVLFLIVIAFSVLPRLQVDKGLVSFLLTSHKSVLHSSQAAIVSLCVVSVFSFPFHILPAAANLFVLVALTSGTLSINSNHLLLSLSMFRTRVATVTFIISSIALSILVVDEYKTYALWKNALQKTQKMDFQASASEYWNLYPKLAKNGKFLFMYGSVLYMVGKDSTSSLVLLKESVKRYTDPNAWVNMGRAYERVGLFDEADECYAKASLILPNAFYPAYLRAKLCTKQGRKDDAIELANRLVSKKPKYPSKAIVEMKTELQKLLKILRN
ncbi:MAG: O-antigen ligase family protein [Nitrososphaera sp.]|jgi:O-antigen ligase